MSEFFVGQVMMTGFNFAPKYFAQCNGQLLPISQNQALFSLLGTQFGGNGTTNFALPDLRGRTPIGFGNSADSGWQPPSVQMGQAGGTENVTLQQNNLPSHGHVMNAVNTDGTSRVPANQFFATSANRQTPPAQLYAAAGSGAVLMNSQSLAAGGGGQPHPNMQPYNTINFCIALSGIFPSRS